MKKLRYVLSLVLALSMLLALSATALAAANDAGFSDVAPDAWYAGAVRYVRDNGLMEGTGDGTAFSPMVTTDLAMVVTILHRDAGEPAVSAAAPEGAAGWYAEAAAWAIERGLLADVNDTFSGVPITREDLVTVLWRYAGSSAGAGEDFADETQISAYAAQAVDWSQANGIVQGKPGNLFDPKGSTTRAELAAILQNFLTPNQQAPAPQPETPAVAGGRTLVVYFSATGSTRAAARYIAEERGGDLFEIVPADPYTSADLNWTDPDSRVNDEHNDPALRNIELVSATVENWDSYDTVFIGYPIWWGIAAWPTDSFVAANDFTGKTVIPFCTSSSSGLGESGELLAELAGTGTWLEGRRFRSSVSQDDVAEWVRGLDLAA